MAGLALCACTGGGNGGTTFVPVAGTGPEIAPSPAQTYAVPIPPGQIDAAVAQLDGLVAEIMKRSQIPGMAVAVVKDGQTVYAKGFGVRHNGAPELVDADTVFQLASMSKSVGATVVAGLVGNGVIAWDTPVVKPLPGFALSDAGSTQNVTVGDFYAHRSGLALRAGDQLEDIGYDRTEVLRRLRYVPLKPLRSTYAYTNFGVTAGAEAAATASGLDWATLSERTLYQPLSMTSTSSRFSDYIARPNRAWPHVLRDGTWQSLYQRMPDAQSPAGGVSSSANDFARWMTLVLQNGSYNGRPLVAASALLPAISPQIVSSPPRDATSRAGFYGFGFNVGTTPAGRVKLSHSGGFTLGAGTAFTMLPAAGVAIVTLTNAQPVGVAEALNAEFEDLVEFGKVTRDWLPAYGALLAPLFAVEGSLAGKAPQASPAPALGSNAYVGTYASDYYGNAVVEPSGAGLVLKMGPGGVTTYALQHWDGNTFVFGLQSENAEPGSVSRVDFTPGPSGISQSLQIEYFAEDIARGVFTRTP